MAMTAEGMLAKIKAAMSPPTQTSDRAAAVLDADAAMLALCKGIIEEIVTNSELVATARDSGSAGSGIQTGSVK